MNRRIFFLAVLVALTLALSVALGGVDLAAAQNEGQIGGIVYEDNNGNGIREEGEIGLKDVEVVLDSGGWSVTISTREDGSFSVAVNPATWVVTVIPPSGYTIADPDREAYIEKAGDAVNNLEFGLVPVTGTDGDVLPDSGSVVSFRVIIGGLIGVLVIGVILVVFGQRWSKSL